MEIMFFSCSEQPDRIEYKLHEQLQDDLKYMVAEVKSATQDSFLLDSPYFVIEDLRMFHGDSAWKIGAYAKVNFFYYDSIPLYQSRKYRYMTRKRFWDRYWKKLEHIGQLKKKENDD